MSNSLRFAHLPWVAALFLAGVLLMGDADAGILCTVVTDTSSEQRLRQDGMCDRPVTPASTFKIAISLMGYDSGFLIDEHSPALPFQDGYPDWGRRGGRRPIRPVGSRTPSCGTPSK